MTLRWFGPRWGAPINFECPQTETPSNPCAWCGEEFLPQDPGIMYMNGEAMHVECFRRQTTGSVAHVLRQCSCYIEGNTETDPPELSVREAARLAVELWDERNDEEGFYRG